MKICFLYESVFTLGGVQRCITTLSNYLVNKGYDVSIICTNTRVPLNRKIYGLDKKVKVIFTKKQNIFRKLINRCLQLIRKLNYRTKILKNNTKILDYIYYYYFGKYVQTIIDKEKFDILIGCGVEHTKLASLVKEKNMKKIGWQHHTYDTYYNLKNRFFWNEDAIIDEMFKNLDKYVVLTLQDKQKLKKIKNKDSVTIYNPIGFKQEEKSSLENKKFLALGRLSKIKGFDLLINSFYEFNKRNKEWTLDIYGDGPERENLEKQIKQLGLEKYINLFHRIDSVKDVYKQASIYCMPSRSEGWGLVTLEAMESGLPIISYNISCMDEIAPNGEVIIVEQENYKKYADAMIKLAENKEKRERFSKKSIERAKDFSIEAIGEKWEKIFEELMKKHNGEKE